MKQNNINLSQEYLDNIESKYKDYLYSCDDELESQFYKENDFKTTVRGVKVRGVYDTLQEAQVRAKMLQQRDRHFNVYVGQVGFWLPWDPESHKVDNEEYADDALNNLVKKYKENKEEKDAHFRENVDYAKEQARKAAEANRAQKQAQSSDTTESSGVEENSAKQTETTTTTTTTSAAEPAAAPVNSVDEEIKQTLDGDDIWLSRQSN